MAGGRRRQEVTGCGRRPDQRAALTGRRATPTDVWYDKAHGTTRTTTQPMEKPGGTWLAPGMALWLALIQP